MAERAPIGHHGDVEGAGETRRYVLVPLAEREPQLVPGSARLRRFGLARLAVSPRSALGVDRHARLEQVAERDRRD
jgi:hypothetical protein